MMTTQERERFRQTVAQAQPEELKALLDPWGHAIPEKELRQIQQYIQSGIPLDLDALLAPFHFTIFPTIWWEVDDKVLVDFANRLRLVASESGFRCALTNIVIVILILDPDTPAAGNSKSVRKGKTGCTVRRHIDIEEWQAASTRKKKSLLEDCVSAALGSIPDKHLDAREKAELEEMARRALYPGRKQAKA